MRGNRTGLWRPAVSGAVCLALAGAAAVPSDDVGDLVRQGDAYRAAFDNRQAYERYSRAYGSDPRNAELLATLTWTCNDVGEDLDGKGSEPCFEEAVRLARQLEKLAPDRARTYFLLAMTQGNLALFRGGREKVRLSRGVEHNARRAIELDPDYAPPYATLGTYYRELATLNWALKAFARTLLGGLPDGTLADSEKMFLTAIEKEPGSVYAHFQLAVTYECMKDRDQARLYYRKTLDLPIVDHQDPVFRKRAEEKLQGA